MPALHSQMRGREFYPANWQHGSPTRLFCVRSEFLTNHISLSEVICHPLWIMRSEGGNRLSCKMQMRDSRVLIREGDCDNLEIQKVGSYMASPTCRSRYSAEWCHDSSLALLSCNASSGLRLGAFLPAWKKLYQRRMAWRVKPARHWRQLSSLKGVTVMLGVDLGH